MNKSFSLFYKDLRKFKHPRFKSKKRSKRSYTTFCQYLKSGAIVFLVENGIRLPKLGIVDAKLHRTPLKDWTLKSATVSQSKFGRYFCSLLFEFEIPDSAGVLPTEKNAIGLGYSSPLFYVNDNGHSPERIRWFRASEEKLVKLQRDLSRMKPRSQNYMRQLHKRSNVSMNTLQIRERTSHTRKAGG